jgi:hypothetical protein
MDCFVASRLAMTGLVGQRSGIQVSVFSFQKVSKPWMPACAGMTGFCVWFLTVEGFG